MFFDIIRHSLCPILDDQTCIIVQSLMWGDSECLFEYNRCYVNEYYMYIICYRLSYPWKLQFFFVNVTNPNFPIWLFVQTKLIIQSASTMVAYTTVVSPHTNNCPHQKLSEMVHHKCVSTFFSIAFVNTCIPDDEQLNVITSTKDRYIWHTCNKAQHVPTNLINNNTCKTKCFVYPT
jgi:hypothetical protein